jgi:hypothetical protein
VAPAKRVDVEEGEGLVRLEELEARDLACCGCELVGVVVRRRLEAFRGRAIRDEACPEAWELVRREPALDDLAKDARRHSASHGFLGGKSEKLRNQCCGCVEKCSDQLEIGGAVRFYLSSICRMETKDLDGADRGAVLR